jgi:drug/metabolite transporter (DMT)-like permease
VSQRQASGGTGYRPGVHWGLLGAFLGAVAYGVATILQTVGARRSNEQENVSVRLLWRLVRSLPFLIGLALDGVGFLLSLAALRSLPLFVVQAVISASLAVTALLAALLLRARLRGRDWAAIAVTSAGLAALATAAGPEHPATVSLFGRMALLVGAAALGVLATAAGRVRPERRPSGWALAVIAGLSYGGAGICARVLQHPGSIAGLARDPATWAMIAMGILGVLLYATAVQRSSVTVVTATVVMVETLVPSAIGVSLLGDRPRHGFAAVAAIGFALTLAGALGLARYGELSPEPKAGEAA